MRDSMSTCNAVRLCLCTTLVISIIAGCLFLCSPAPSLLSTAATLAVPVDGASSVYNFSDAWKALHFCKTAYCPVVNVTHWDCGNACSNATSNFHVFNVYDNTSTGNVGFSGMDHEAEKIVVAFRGTFNTANWIQDMDFWSMPYPHPACGDGCRIHRGFYKAYDSVREQLIEDVLSMFARYPTYTLFITGHSLGGAMAVLCAIEFTTWHLPKTEGGSPRALRDAFAATDAPHLTAVELYTFGEPRVGNEYFTNWSTSVLSLEHQYRVTHARDPVPHLPPRSWGYVHVPQEHWYPVDDNVYMQCADTASAEDPECSNSVFATTVSDHLLYLGVCTRCECTAPEMAEIYNYTLSPDKLGVLALEYAMEHDRHGHRHTVS